MHWHTKPRVTVSSPVLSYLIAHNSFSSTERNIINCVIKMQYSKAAFQHKLEQAALVEGGGGGGGGTGACKPHGYPKI